MKFSTTNGLYKANAAKIQEKTKIIYQFFFLYSFLFYTFVNFSLYKNFTTESYKILIILNCNFFLPKIYLVGSWQKKADQAVTNIYAGAAGSFIAIFTVVITFLLLKSKSALTLYFLYNILSHIL